MAEQKGSDESNNGDVRGEHGEHSERGEHSGRTGRTEREVFVISVAAEITGMHAQTLRTYDRMGLVSPERTRGGGRRYSQDDIEQLQEIQRLSHDDGVNLAGIKAIIELQNRVRDLEDEAAVLRRRLAAAERRADGAAGATRRHGEIVHVPRSTAVVLWEQRRRGQERPDN
ncbi:MAG TPA: helix-turn-helix transcriptional regulator [Candidatus Corynebacterium avicola]|uniref:Helix-turn-helix transcriptional regulator n=1 Tax=Candidatus Corynebacterium avicola TaxID=2838527 RepID=A0A9D1UMX2_9CORY|nr:helix-turn-helix transcriptional regulator [Candidatus Corynebacterium avicola]